MAVFVFLLLLVCFRVPSSSAGNFKIIAETRIPTTYTEFTFKQRVLDDMADLIKAAEKAFVVTTQWVKDTALGALKLVVNCEPIYTQQEKKSLGAIVKGVGNILSIIPESFAAVERWLECKGIIDKVPGMWIKNCSLGWALAFAKTLSDRMCISSNGKIKIEASVADLIQRCGAGCLNSANISRIGVEPKFGISASIGGNLSAGGSISIAPHCWGGNAARAWNHWAKNGIVSGGWTRDSNLHGCLPLFGLFTLLFNISLQHAGGGECYYQNANQKKSAMSTYQNEIRQYKPVSPVVYTLHGEKQIQSEIMQHGPVQAGMDLYEDFFLYKSGIYSHMAGELIGYHSVVIVGWGRSEGKKYWDVINVWGPEFGNKGRVWILRGNNECNIESYVIAGRDTAARGAEAPATGSTGKPKTGGQNTQAPKQDKPKEEKKSDEKSSAILNTPLKIYLLAIIGSFVLYFV